MYVSSKPDLVRRFFKRHGVGRNVVVLSGDENAFKEGSRSIMAGLGFERHAVYPSAVHAYLSPKDSNHSGAAKRAWREMDLGWSDGVASSLAQYNDPATPPPQRRNDVLVRLEGFDRSKLDLPEGISSLARS